MLKLNEIRIGLSSATCNSTSITPIPHNPGEAKAIRHPQLVETVRTIAVQIAIRIIIDLDI